MTANDKYLKKNCLFCGEKEAVQELYPQTFKDSDLTPAVFSARRVTEHFHYKTVKCKCGLVFAKEILSDEILFSLYSQSAVTFEKYISVLRRDYWLPLKKYSHMAKNSTALEIGCSSGFFLEELLGNGFKKVRGCEPSTEAKEKAAQNVKNLITTGFFKGKATFPNDKFDLICSFQTLDHISDPNNFMSNCREVLSTNGLVYFVTHNVQALQAKLLKDKSPIIDVEHIYLFNKKTIAKLLEKHEFKVLEVGNFRNSYPIEYWLNMLPIPNSTKAMAHKVLKFFHANKLSPSLAAGNLFIIAQKM